MMGRKAIAGECYSGKHIALLRARRGHTTGEAAASVGVSRRTWQRWEAGDTTADPRCVREYAEGLDAGEG